MAFPRRKGNGDCGKIQNPKPHLNRQLNLHSQENNADCSSKATRSSYRPLQTRLGEKNTPQNLTENPTPPWLHFLSARQNHYHQSNLFYDSVCKDVYCFSTECFMYAYIHHT